MTKDEKQKVYGAKRASYIEKVKKLEGKAKHLSEKVKFCVDAIKACDAKLAEGDDEVKKA